MPVTSTQKLAELTQLVMNKTIARELAWEGTSIERAYAAKLGDYIIQISEEPGKGMQPDYIIRIFNKSSEMLEMFSDVDLAGLSTGSDYDGFFNLMGDLYIFAARQSSGADEAINEIINLLK